MKENLIKIYFYVTSGQSVIDQFRYLIMGIFTLYIMLKLTSYVYLVVMFTVAMPALFILGWVNVHFISKVREKLSTQHGTHYAIKQFELQEETVKLLKDIKKLLTYTQVKKKK